LTRRGFDVRKICLQHAFQIQFERRLRRRRLPGLHRQAAAEDEGARADDRFQDHIDL